MPYTTILSPEDKAEWDRIVCKSSMKYDEALVRLFKANRKAIREIQTRILIGEIVFVLCSILFAYLLGR